MATILNAYNLSGGDTTSTTFTSAGDCVTIEATTTNVSGVNTLLKIQSSDDQSTWKDIGQILIGVGSDIYCIDPIKLTGLYVRVLLITNDTLTGNITVTAANPTAGSGIPTTGTPYKMIQYDVNGDAQEVFVITDDSGVDSFDIRTRQGYDTSGNLVIGWNYQTLYDTSGVAVMQWNTRQLIDSATNETVDWENKRLSDVNGKSVSWGERNLLAADGSTVHINWTETLGMVLSSVIANGSFADDTAAGLAGLTTGMPYYTNVAGEGILKIKL